MLSDMDALSFDGYTSYSDSSAPRTPSPRADLPYPSPTHIYEDEVLNAGAPSGYRGSLLQELYGHEEGYSKQQQQQQQHSQMPPTSSHPTIPRRATFPYVRHDAPSYPPSYDGYEESYAVVPSHGPSGPQAYYQPPPHNPYLQQSPPHHHHHPYGPPSSGMLPAPAMAMGGMPGMPMGPYGHLQPALPIQHTDDAASKETQYLRRRCFNCHTTEPPSWRRSTLNPGKIVCNKCGLYERTHLRPRPLRFDELRAGGKSRKNSLSNSNGGTGGNAKTSPKSPGKSLVKKESVDVGLGRIRGNRRSSVSSSAGSGSDWDDNAQPPQLYPTQPEVQYPYDSSFAPTSGYVTSSPPGDSPTFVGGPPGELYGSPYNQGSPYHQPSASASASPYHHSHSNSHSHSHSSSASPPDTTHHSLTLPPIIPEEATPTKRASN
ncbi:putative GATA type transcriptional activator [Lentinula detonsa]|uniref:GATA type transcriptional activator n=1 Tax=Lentinula detonsa TaxID=2804962 RepID=A0A9W8TUY1_9AGAR|nr:putative GATA type transcriptional activator [Lentinula detonsa]